MFDCADIQFGQTLTNQNLVRVLIAKVPEILSIVTNSNQCGCDGCRACARHSLDVFHDPGFFQDLSIGIDKSGTYRIVIYRIMMTMSDDVTAWLMMKGPRYENEVFL